MGIWVEKFMLKCLQLTAETRRLASLPCSLNFGMQNGIHHCTTPPSLCRPLKLGTLFLIFMHAKALSDTL